MSTDRTSADRRPADKRQRTLGSAAADAGSAVLAAYTAHEAINHASTAAGVVGAVKAGRDKAGKFVARGRAGGAPVKSAGGSPIKGVPTPKIEPSSPVSRASNAINAVRSQSSAAISKASTVAAKAADSRGGQALAKGFNAVANSKVAGVAAKVSLPLLIARAGWNAGKGYAEDGVRGAGRGLIQTLDPTALLSMLAGKTGVASSLAGSAGDGRGVGERIYDHYLGSASKSHAREADHLSAPISGSGEQRSSSYSSMIAHGVGSGTGMALGVAKAASPSSPGNAGTEQSKGSESDAQANKREAITRQNFQTKDGRTVDATPKQQEAYLKRRNPDIKAPKLARKVPI